MKKRRMILMTSMVLAVLLIAGGTFAWFTAKAEDVENDFKAGTVELDLKECFYDCGADNVNPGDCFYKHVYIKNTGTKKARFRIKLDNQFEDGLPTDGVVKYDLYKGLLNYRYWKDGGDGYIYYRNTLRPGQYTRPLFKNDKICFDGEAMNDDYQGKKFTMTIGAEAIQSSNGAPEEEWGLTWGGGSQIFINSEEEYGLEEAPEMSPEMIEYMENK